MQSLWDFTCFEFFGPDGVEYEHHYYIEWWWPYYLGPERFEFVMGRGSWYELERQSTGSGLFKVFDQTIYYDEWAAEKDFHRLSILYCLTKYGWLFASKNFFKVRWLDWNSTNVFLERDEEIHQLDYPLPGLCGRHWQHGRWWAGKTAHDDWWAQVDEVEGLALRYRFFRNWIRRCGSQEWYEALLAYGYTDELEMDDDEATDEPKEDTTASEDWTDGSDGYETAEEGPCQFDEPKKKLMTPKKRSLCLRGKEGERLARLLTRLKTTKLPGWTKLLVYEDGETGIAVYSKPQKIHGDKALGWISPKLWTESVLRLPAIGRL